VNGLLLVLELDVVGDALERDRGPHVDVAFAHVEAGRAEHEVREAHARVRHREIVDRAHLAAGKGDGRARTAAMRRRRVFMARRILRSDGDDATAGRRARPTARVEARLDQVGGAHQRARLVERLLPLAVGRRVVDDAAARLRVEHAALDDRGAQRDRRVHVVLEREVADAPA
jgi:hypothetical protein